jgi:hypothetical protein
MPIVPDGVGPIICHGLLRRLQFALQPARYLFGVDRVGLVAIKALELARPLAIRGYR